MITVNYQIKPFENLSGFEVYQIGQLRQAVFVVEQNCNYLDFDNKDFLAWHVLVKNVKNELISYCRLLPPNVSYPNECCIGRVANDKAVRGLGIGRKMMETAIESCSERWQNVPIRISAQDYLLKFYESLGFIATDKRYLEDSLPHTEMYRPF